MQVLETYKRAWRLFMRHPLAWILTAAVPLLLGMATCCLGLVLCVNLMREAAAAIDEERAPTLNTLFSFDNIAEDALTLIIVGGTGLILSSFGGIGGLFAGIPMIWMLCLAVDGRYPPLEAAQISVFHGLSDLGRVVPFGLFTALLGYAPLCLFLPVFIVVPVAAIAHWLLYTELRDDIEAIAEQRGFTPRSSP